MQWDHDPDRHLPPRCCFFYRPDFYSPQRSLFLARSPSPWLRAGASRLALVTHSSPVRPYIHSLISTDLCSSTLSTHIHPFARKYVHLLFLIVSIHWSMNDFIFVTSPFIFGCCVMSAFPFMWACKSKCTCFLLHSMFIVTICNSLKIILVAFNARKYSLNYYIILVLVDSERSSLDFQRMRKISKGSLLNLLYLFWMVSEFL